ncbi:MAG: helix-turn-helix transcriptional regulator [Lachnospiraceae bacterium]|nr:helix-turn-helix transcriptional regulator [Lachnospiraceae bacterium]
MRIDRVKLVAELARQDMTQLRLAELAGISRITVNGIVNGRSCSRKTADKIATTLKVDLQKLI